MDTIMTITAYGSQESVEAAKNAVLKLEAEINDKTVCEDIEYMTETASLIRDISGGALDITIAPVVRAWGFGDDDGEYRVPEQSEIEELLASRSENDITFGAVAKGYAADLAARALKDGGCASAIINLGANVYALGVKPDGSEWNVAIADPFDTSKSIGIISVSGKAVVTSGSYQRYFEQDGKRYWHIIDPATGYPADSGVVSVTIIGESGILCDAYSTALFVLGLDRTVEIWRERGDFEFVIVTTGGDIYISSGIKNTFSAERSYEVVR